jgi:4-hydroxy-tetrahydrodipicolinate synthase
MVTPLLPDLSADTESVERLVRLFSEHGLHVLVLGTTGESPSIEASTAAEIVAAAVQARGYKQHIYAGMVDTNVRRLIAQGNEFMRLGVDAVVATLPAYYALTPCQMIQYYTQLADQIQGPVMMYNIQSTTHQTMPLEVIAQLSQHPGIYGLKDSDRDPDRLDRLIELFADRPDFSFFCGWGAQGAYSLLKGADGIVPSTANAVPDWYGQLWQAVLANQEEVAYHWQKKTDQFAVLYQHGRTLGESLAALKVIVAEQGFCGTTMMPPLTSLEPAEEEKLRQQYRLYF